MHTIFCKLHFYHNVLHFFCDLRLLSAHVGLLHKNDDNTYLLIVILYYRYIYTTITTTTRQRQVWFIPLADERGVCS